jgi:hypothetical protein
MAPSLRVDCGAGTAVVQMQVEDDRPQRAAEVRRHARHLADGAEHVQTVATPDLQTQVGTARRRDRMCEQTPEGRE